MRNLLLSALLLTSAFQTAFGQTYTSGDYQYTLSNNQATITGYTGAGGAVSIPNTLNSYPVVSIGAEAFQYGAGLTSVTIPSSVTRIGNYAFYYCTSLTSVTIPNSVTSIETYAFDHCTSLTSVTIPSSVTSIVTYAFYYCTSLTSVTILNGVTSIETYAFYPCTSLTSVTIPSSVTSIGTYAFNPSGLGNVFLSSTTTFPSNAFPSTAVFYYGSTTGTAMATQAQLATTQADLATTKAELAKIKADLAKTKTDLGTWFAQFPLTLKRILPKLIWSK